MKIYMYNVPAAIRELEKIEMVRQLDGVYRLDHAVTATQKTILNQYLRIIHFLRKSEIVHLARIDHFLQLGIILTNPTAYMYGIWLLLRINTCHTPLEFLLDTIPPLGLHIIDLCAKGDMDDIILSKGGHIIHQNNTESMHRNVLQDCTLDNWPSI